MSLPLSTVLGASRFFKVEPPQALVAGDISPAVEVPFNYGSGWLVSLHHSIWLEDDETPDYFYYSKIACQIHLSGEPYTEGARGGAEFIILSDFHGDYHDRHYLMRRVCTDDSLTIRWKNIAEYDIVHDIEVMPSLVFWYLLDADIAGNDLHQLLNYLGVPPWL